MMVTRQSRSCRLKLTRMRWLLYLSTLVLRWFERELRSCHGRNKNINNSKTLFMAVVPRNLSIFNLHFDCQFALYFLKPQYGCKLVSIYRCIKMFFITLSFFFKFLCYSVYLAIPRQIQKKWYWISQWNWLTILQDTIELKKGIFLNDCWIPRVLDVKFSSP